MEAPKEKPTTFRRRSWSCYGDFNSPVDSPTDSGYIVRVTSMNLLPTRQNIFFSDSSNVQHGLVPCSSEKFRPLHVHTMPESRALDELQAQLLSWNVNTQASIESVVSADCSARAMPVEELAETDTLNRCQATFNLSNTILGAGVLSVPFAFRLSGYISILLLMMVIWVTTRTAIFIGDALRLAESNPISDAVPRRGRDFAFLAHVAFGKLGHICILSVTSLEIWFALVTYLVMNSVNVTSVMPSLGKVQAIMISTGLTAMMVFIPMRIYSYLSMVSFTALFVAVFSMVCAAFTMSSWANPYDSTNLIQVANLPRSIGLMVFCFAGHPCFPLVHECMEDRRQWKNAVNLSFLISFIYYGGLGMFGFWVFGDGLEANFNQNLAHLKGAIFWRDVSAIAFALKIQLTTPLLFNAVIVAICPPTSVGGEWPAKRLAMLFLVACLTFLISVFFADRVAVAASLCGSLFTMLTSVLFPAIVHMRLQWRYGKTQDCKLTSFTSHYVVIIFGIVMATVGSGLCIWDMIDVPRKSA